MPKPAAASPIEPIIQQWAIRPTQERSGLRMRNHWKSRKKWNGHDCSKHDRGLCRCGISLFQLGYSALNGYQDGGVRLVQAEGFIGRVRTGRGSKHPTHLATPKTRGTSSWNHGDNLRWVFYVGMSRYRIPRVMACAWFVDMLIATNRQSVGEF